LADSIAAHLMPAHVLPTPVLWEDADFIDSMHLHERAAQEFSAAVGQAIQRLSSGGPLTSP
ncbi:MAG: hypothetical protein NZ740_10755, partial [Kiritimatiellae bacterium]|nr:hypothetical protein [Kiritimatiellia bacterium]MDW8459563.1 hypothetical protein [Verrucomicrobiota bacterium]